jgi:hypothetical protein
MTYFFRFLDFLKILPRLVRTQRHQKLSNRTNILNQINMLKRLYEVRSNMSVDYRNVELNSYEAKFHSQNGEDGILLELLFRINQITPGLAVNVGSGGETSNTRLLTSSFKFKSLEIDVNMQAIENAKKLDNDWSQSSQMNNIYLNKYIQPNELSKLVFNYFGDLEVDLISIDIDGLDFWFWKNLDIRPKIVCMEYNASYGPTKSLTIPNDPNFERFKYSSNGWHHGASLTALAKLGEQLGYALLGCESNGVNSFFIREDLLNIVGFTKKTPLESFRWHFQRPHVDISSSKLGMKLETI